MNKFNVGNWVVHRYISDTTIYVVQKIQNENQVYVEYDNCGYKSHTIIGNSLLRQATVLDYIRTMSAEQIVKSLTRVGFDVDCGHCSGCSDKPSWCSCTEWKIIQWLNQPLTNKIIKQLGGKE